MDDSVRFLLLKRLAGGLFSYGNFFTLGIPFYTLEVANITSGISLIYLEEERILIF